MTRAARPKPAPLAVVANPKPVLAVAAESCGLCRYYAPAEARGICRRGPPEFGRTVGNWPVVQDSEWCGEFRR